MNNKKLLKQCSIFQKATSDYDPKKGKGKSFPGDMTYRGDKLDDLEEMGHEIKYVGHGSASPYHIRKFLNNDLSYDSIDREWSYSFEFENYEEAVKIANKLFDKTGDTYAVVDSFGSWVYTAEPEESKMEQMRNKEEEDKIQLQYDLEFGNFSDEKLTDRFNNSKISN